MCIKKFGTVTYLSNGKDEYYIEKNINNDFLLYHKNKSGNKKCWHLEKKIFSIEQDAIEYCRKHQYKTKKEDRNFRNVEKLFLKI